MTAKALQCGTDSCHSSVAGINCEPTVNMPHSCFCSDGSSSSVSSNVPRKSPDAPYIPLSDLLHAVNLSATAGASTAAAFRSFVTVNWTVGDVAVSAVFAQADARGQMQPYAVRLFRNGKRTALHFDFFSKFCRNGKLIGV
jgi:hypothetical protein